MLPRATEREGKHNPPHHRDADTTDLTPVEIRFCSLRRPPLKKSQDALCMFANRKARAPHDLPAEKMKLQVGIHGEIINTAEVPRNHFQGAERRGRPLGGPPVMYYVSTDVVEIIHREGERTATVATTVQRSLLQQKSVAHNTRAGKVL